MSLAGTRSSQGDEYQLRVALHWLIRLLEDPAIWGIQVESVGLPEHDLPVTVDDVVILYKDGRVSFIQAKKNQPQHRHWSFSDTVLQDELRKARDQLESHENSQVWFYSRSPFGDLKALAEGCQIYPDFAAFTRDAPATLSESLNQLATLLERSEQEAYSLAKRLRFGRTFEFEDWDRQNLADLDRLVPRADEAMPLLERYLASHQARLRDPRYITPVPT